MRLQDITIPVSVLPGTGPESVKQFANLNIFTVSDLLSFYPRSYKDRTKWAPLNLFETVKEVHTIAQVTGHEWFGYGRMKTLKILIRDSTARAELICFSRPFLEKAFPCGCIIVVSGSFFIKYNALQCSSFEAQKIADGGSLDDFVNGGRQAVAALAKTSGIIPVYPLTQGLSQKKVSKAVQAALSQYLPGIDDELSAEIISKRGLLSKQDALYKIHRPQSLAEAESARRRLAYEELFSLQRTVFLRAYEHRGSLPAPDIADAARHTAQPAAKAQTDSKNDFSPRQAALLERLPFALTKDQLNVISQMNRDIDRGYKERSDRSKDAAKAAPFTMQRLLQGDVGSGKTLAALFACLRVTDWGGQCAFMAPTEILAKQHAENTGKLLEPLGVRTAFLSGNLKSSARKPLLNALKNGEIDILAGTHALFSKSTVYSDLQLAVIDEQHRFGVMQRQAIIEKGRALLSAENKTVYASPHVLMMSATPIPQTLALTVYGDLDVSTIKTMPAGRKSVITYLVAEGHEMNAYNAVRKELEKGRQAYFVYPAIDASGEAEEALQAPAAKDARSPDLISAARAAERAVPAIKTAQAAFENLSRNIFPQYKCALIHSKIAEDEQTRILNDFRENKIQILAATTVVEVGVDVPNATCMVVEQADMFGLSPLHQLRGRVGRGTEQSYCFLIYRKNITENGIARMKILRQTNDGFIIAEEDLKLRGPGQITGTAQSGQLELGIADLSRDRELLMHSRADAYNSLAASAGGIFAPSFAGAI